MLITIAMANIVNFNQSLLSPYLFSIAFKTKKGESGFFGCEVFMVAF